MFNKEVFLRLSVCVVCSCDSIIGRLNYYFIGMYPAYIYIFLHESADDYITQAAAGIGLHVNAHKTEYFCYNQTGDVSTLERNSLKLVDKFTYLESSVSPNEKKHRHTAIKGMDSYR